jgi:hypothetical protein
MDNIDLSNNNSPLVESTFKNIVFCDLTSDEDDNISVKLPNYHRNIFINTNPDKNIIVDKNFLTPNSNAFILNDIITEINNMKKDIQDIQNNMKPISPFSIIDTDIKTNKNRNKKNCTIL